MKNWKMRAKLLFILLLAGIVPVAITTILGLFNTSSNLISKSQDQLEAVQEIKKNQIEQFFAERLGDLELAAQTPGVRESMLALNRWKTQSGETQSARFTATGADYQTLFSSIDEHLGMYGEIYGYYDVFLMDATDGYVLYTWAKEPDYLTSLSQGAYKDSHLAETWREILETGDLVLSDMEAYAPSDGAPAMFVGAPVKDGRNIIGTLVMQISLESINAIMQERTGMGESGETYLVGSDKLMRSDSYLDPENHSVAASMARPQTGRVDTQAVNLALSGIRDVKQIIDYNGNPVYSAFAPIRLGENNWVLLAEIDVAEVLAPVYGIIFQTILVVLVIIGVLILVAILFAGSISKPLQQGVHLAKEVALGDLSASLEINQKDEIGELARAIMLMVRSMREKAQVVSTFAKGDLTPEIQLASEKDELGKNLQLMKASLNELLGQVDQAVVQMASGADQVSTASQDLSQGATEQASSLEEISASSSEIAGQSKQNSDNAQEAAGLAKKNTQDATSGNQLMQELIEVMEMISESSNKTRKIVKTIDDIAFQVNLLALNANVEAARAGKYGRGFAVVAEEVRTLAVRSAKAVQETTEMVDESQSRVALGNQKVKATSGQLVAILESSVKIADFLDEISQASREQNLAMDQVNKGLGQIDEVTQSNTASAEESASAAEELASQAQHLKTMLSRFILEHGNQQRLALGSPQNRQGGGERLRVQPIPMGSSSPQLNNTDPARELSGSFEDF